MLIVIVGKKIHRGRNSYVALQLSDGRILLGQMDNSIFTWIADGVKYKCTAVVGRTYVPYECSNLLAEYKAALEIVASNAYPALTTTSMEF